MAAGERFHTLASLLKDSEHLPPRYRRRPQAYPVVPTAPHADDPLVDVPMAPSQGPSLHDVGVLEETDMHVFDPNDVVDLGQGGQVGRVSAWNRIVYLARAVRRRLRRVREDGGQ